MKWVLLTVFVAGIFLYVIGSRLLKDMESTYFALEHVTYQEIADQACALDCLGLKLFALTNYLGFLEGNRGLLSMPTNDFNYALFQTHGRLFRFYSELTNDTEAVKEFVAASNYYRLFRPNPLDRSLLLTNPIFQVNMR